MADMIARLKVDSSEYDSKIQRAARGIQDLARACHDAGGHLNVLEDENREYIQSLGNMATVAQTTRGKIAELTSAFIDIKSVYNSLSDEEKKGEFGRELNRQLDIMKGRIQDGKRELADINNEINGGGGLTGALDNLAAKFGMNIKQLAGWGTALAAAKGALDVAKDAFFANEQQLDEWGRMAQSSESLYQGFLNALNNSDISGFLTRMDDIVSAAREAYNALDDLNTYNAFNQRNEMKERAGYTKALDEYKLNPTADNKKALADANKSVIDGLRETQQKTEDAYMAALRQIANERLNDKKLQAEFVKVFSEGGRNALADAKIGYSQGKMLNAGAQYWYGDRVYDGRIQDRSTGKWRDMSQQEKQNFEFARALSQVNDSQIKEVQALGRQSQAIADQIYQQDRAYNRMAGNNGKVSPGSGGGRGGRGGGDTTKTLTELQENQKKINELTQQYVDVMSAAAKAGNPLTDEQKEQTAEIQKQIQELEKRNGLLNYYAGKAKGLYQPQAGDFDKNVGKFETNPFAADNKEMEFTGHLKLQLDEDTMKAVNNQIGQSLAKDGDATAQSWRKASQAIGSVSGAFASIENPATKIAGTIGQAIATIAMAYAETLAKDKSNKSNVWYFIATAAAAMVSMAATISSIHSSTGYAEGGIVKGNHYSGDMIPANGGTIGLNAGEVVLNRAQQGNLAAQLQGGLSQMRIIGVLKGENVAMMLDNYGKATGRGELAFWR